MAVLARGGLQGEGITFYITAICVIVNSLSFVVALWHWAKEGKVSSARKSDKIALCKKGSHMKVECKEGYNNLYLSRMRQSALFDSGVSVATLSSSSTFFFKLATSAAREVPSSRRAWHSDTLRIKCSLVFCAYSGEEKEAGGGGGGENG